MSLASIVVLYYTLTECLQLHTQTYTKWWRATSKQVYDIYMNAKSIYMNAKRTFEYS